jgi:TIR domain
VANRISRRPANGTIPPRIAVMAHDVFISYASKDTPTADATCASLEARGIRCWIAPRDVPLGSPYGNAITDAIRGCRIMVVVLSSQANESIHIPKEVERAVSIGATIIPLRIEAVLPGPSLDYFIGSVHWLDALNPPLEKHLETLAAAIRKILPNEEKTADGRRLVIEPTTPKLSPAAVQAAARAETTTTTFRSYPAIWKRPWVRLCGIGALLLFAAFGMKLWWHRPPPLVTIPKPTPSSGTAKTWDLRTDRAEAPQPQFCKRLAQGDPLAEDSTTPSPGAVWSNLLAITGCWKWENGEPLTNTVEIHADHTIAFPNPTFGPLRPGKWRMLNVSARTYELTWSNNSTEAVSASVDGKQLSRVEVQRSSRSSLRASRRFPVWSGHIDTGDGGLSLSRVGARINDLSHLAS